MFFLGVFSSRSILKYIYLFIVRIQFIFLWDEDISFVGIQVVGAKIKIPTEAEELLPLKFVSFGIDSRLTNNLKFIGYFL